MSTGSVSFCPGPLKKQKNQEKSETAKAARNE